MLLAEAGTGWGRPVYFRDWEPVEVFSIDLVRRADQRFLRITGDGELTLYGANVTLRYRVIGSDDRCLQCVLVEQKEPESYDPGISIIPLTS